MSAKHTEYLNKLKNIMAMEKSLGMRIEEFAILLAIKRGTNTKKELSAVLNMEYVSVMNFTRWLITKGFLQKQPNLLLKTEKKFFLTEKAEKLIYIVTGEDPRKTC